MSGAERVLFDGLNRKGWRTGGARQLAWLCLAFFPLAVDAWLGVGPAIVSASFSTLLLVIAERWRARPRTSRDPLSRLPLRTELTEAVDLAIEASDGITPVAVMAVAPDDLDGVLRRFGRETVAEVLRATADRLSRSLRHGDVMARVDASRFAVCLSDFASPGTETLLDIARRLQSTADAPVETAAGLVHISVSVGIVANSQIDRATGAGMLDAALRAQGAAAVSGPGSVRVYSETSGRNRSDGDLAGELAAALENGEIEAWFQPQVSTDTGSVSGFEALARWRHPARGMIAPALFLPLIERQGLSQRLAEVMLGQALSALNAWDRAGFAIPSVSVNFSSDELRNPSLSDHVRWELDRHDLSPSRLTVEVLESVVAESHEDMAARNLRALSSIGCRIDLDDFGTGYTSILNIRRFAVSRVKIDRCLISHADTDRGQQDMVAAILGLCDRLGIETLAEGVETEGEQAILSQLGCGYLQGFGIARPMPFAETMGWVPERHGRAARAVSKRLPSG